MNIDVAVSKNTGRGSAAAVAQDRDGVFWGASVIMFLGRTEPETLEALACWEALALARDIDVRNIQVMSDCINVITNLEQGTMGVYAHIIREIKESVQDFDAISFHHERRSLSLEGDRPAKSNVLLEQGHQVWLITPHVGVGISMYSEA
jgi:ribonuclease HI